MSTTQVQRRSPVERFRAILGLSAQNLIGAPSHKALFPFIPRSVKLLILFVFVLNWRSWPFVWHFKILKYYTRLHLDEFFLARTASARRMWLNRISIIGANPFELVSTVKCYAGIDDIYLDRLSETSVRKACDRGRAKVDSGLYPALFGDGVYTALGSSHSYFIRGIPRGTAYEVRTTIGGWDKKWVYLVHHFVTYPNTKSKAHAVDVTPATRTEIEPSQTAAVARANIPKFYTKTPLPENALVHCIAISTAVFKAGRITVPPSVAFIAGGFGDPSKQRWDHIQNLRFSKRYAPANNKPKHVNRMKAIMKGGWRTDEVDGWDMNPKTGLSTFWELEEYEQTRAENVQSIFESIQVGLTNLKDRRYH
ncbi:hypothetical protein FRB94_001974 [Tulasnella sp. JGI-2019a]|nr:hypothetical protein FRB93_010076 [Tulasnella sp. JGI-2019a]KAG9004936.1 hypothetical protein FRB94_001974 [Tulasnella sp. JGI-2019a]KAG9030151.1 hypothetical protein FRB95_004289 [Tulasnella sp. JGI-2019a]